MAERPCVLAESLGVFVLTWRGKEVKPRSVRFARRYRSRKQKRPLEVNMAKNALITGASRGLGRALTHELAEQGWGLVIDARSRKALEEAQAELAGSNGSQ